MTKQELITKLTEIRDSQINEEMYFEIDQLIMQIQQHSGHIIDTEEYPDIPRD